LLDQLSMPPSLLSAVGLDPKEERFQASMGIYLFNRSVLEAALDNDYPDFGKNIIPNIIKERNVYSYIFNDYWEDIGTIASYYEANLECTKVVPKFNFFDPDNPIYTRARLLPASKINNAVIEEALLSDGCIITSATIRRSIIGVRSVIEAGCEITDSIIIGSDYYSRTRIVGDNEDQHRIFIGGGTKIHRAIIDKNVTIGRNVDIHPRGRTHADTEWCHIRDGIVVVPKGTIIPDGTVV